MRRAHRRRTLLLGLAALLSVLALVVPLAAQSGAAGTLVFIGTYASPASKGIYVSRLDPSTGALSTPTLAAEIRNPSFLAASPDGRFLYAVSEVDAVAGTPGGAVAAYAIDKAAGTLKALNTQSTVGGGPCHVSVAGRMVFAANYGGGSVAAYPIEADGTLKPASTFVQHKGSSVNTDRQKAPHAHARHARSVGALPLRARPRARSGARLPHRRARPGRSRRRRRRSPRSRRPAPGRATSRSPRRPARLRDHRDGLHDRRVRPQRHDRRADADRRRSARCRPGRRSTTGFSTAEVLLHPSGKFLYGSNRGHDSLVVYGVDASTGKLTLLQHVPTGGKTPRAFNIDPTGTFLIVGNQNSDTVGVFRIDPARAS